MGFHDLGSSLRVLESPYFWKLRMYSRTSRNGGAVRVLKAHMPITSPEI